jgi:hypothetical protein
MQAMSGEVRHVGDDRCVDLPHGWAHGDTWPLSSEGRGSDGVVMTGNCLHDWIHCPLSGRTASLAYSRFGSAFAGLGVHHDGSNAAAAVLQTCRRDVRFGAPLWTPGLGTQQCSDVGFQTAPVPRGAWPRETGRPGLG